MQYFIYPHPSLLEGHSRYMYALVALVFFHTINPIVIVRFKEAIKLKYMANSIEVDKNQP